MDRFTILATRAAKNSTLNSMHGSLLISKHKVIDTGTNSSRSIIYGNLCASVHAEVDCMRRHCILRAFKGKKG